MNRLLHDHALPPVALGPLVARVRKGLENCQKDTRPLPNLLALPDPVVLAILDLAERLLPTVHYDCRDPKLLLLRVADATITAYLFINRR